MVRRTVVVGVVVAAFVWCAGLVLERALAGSWLVFGVHPGVVELLERSMSDQKNLAELDPEHEQLYRARFAETRAAAVNLRVLGHSRAALAGRLGWLTALLFGGTLGIAIVVQSLRKARDEQRLRGLGQALETLATGRGRVVLGDRRRDHLGRIARMVERTSETVERDRQRLAALDSLAAWQEAARRHAHELRTPLTAARLELARAATVADEPQGSRDQLKASLASVGEEFDRLSRLVTGLTSFARLPRPQPEDVDLDTLLGDFVATFGVAWSNLELELQPVPAGILARVDRDMLRQVLTNLCDNSSNALGPRRGTVTISASQESAFADVDLWDDGPGVSAEVTGRLFEPYTTTRNSERSMGLGLAIARKIMLDHGGDLILVSSSSQGARFRLQIPLSRTEEEP